MSLFGLIMHLNVASFLPFIIHNILFQSGWNVQKRCHFFSF